MGKYDPLTHHLKSQRLSEVRMKFSDIEDVLGFPLPASSRHHRAWWSNNPSNSVMTKAWLEAGYESRQVDMAAERLVFVRLNEVERSADAPLQKEEAQTEAPRSVLRLESPAPRAGRSGRHPLWGSMAGTVTIPPGTDLTEPMWTDEEIERSIDETARLIAEGFSR